MEDGQRIARLQTALAERIGRQRFELWFTGQTRFEFADHRLVVHVANTFLRDWIQRNFSSDLRTCCADVLGCDAQLEFEVDASLLLTNGTTVVPNCRPPVRDDAPADNDGQPIAGRIDPEVQRSSPAATAIRRSAARDAMTFESLVVGCGNQFAAHAAEMIAAGAYQATPVTFWGPTGVGKTHLLRAIQAAYRRQHGSLRAVYLTAEQFTSGFVAAVRGSGLPSFRHKCRGADLLLIDDVHFFAGKRNTLSELLYTVDTLARDGRQLVLASDRTLGELQFLGAEMVSRLVAGGVCELNPPDYAMRLQIVRQIAQRMGISLAESLHASIATYVTSGAREVQGALYRLQLCSAAFDKPIDQQLVDKELGELALQNSRPVKLVDIQNAVCNVFGIDASGLRSDSKSRSLSEPRMLAMWLARKYTRAPWSEIGEFFGRRAHSTVISAHRRVERLMSDHGIIGVSDKPCPVEDAIRRVETALRRA